MDEVVVVSELHKSYGPIHAVNGLTFSVKRGEVFGLLGPNGAGKTTTMEMIVGLRIPDRGTIKILGLDSVRQGKVLKAKIGVQLQSTALFPRLTVAETLRTFATFYPNPFPVPDVLRWVGLERQRQQYVGQLSQGQKQRLAVGLAVLGNGELVLLDEPTTGLDPQARRALWDLIRQLQGLGKTIFLSTHYMEEADALCSRVAILDQGQILALDSPASLVRRFFADQTIEVELRPDAQLKLPADLNGAKVAGHSREKVVLTSPDPVDTLVRLAECNLRECAHSIAIRQACLEDVFLHLTGRRIR